VFFQATLLAGYIYAHLLSKYVPLHWQVLVHGGALSLGVFFLPLAIATGWTPPAEGTQAGWLIALFAVSIGAPFFAISANAPLLQRWFSHTDHPLADNPYFLYAASNAGSLIALCLYPILIEPMLRLQQQTALWANGYQALIIIILGAGLIGILRQATGLKMSPDTQSSASVTLPALDWPQRLLWIFLAFVPSSLMLGVTSHMTNNIASAPFLWIIPLALYLLTFVIVFANRPLITSEQLKRLFPAVIVIAFIGGFILKTMVLLSITVSLVCYFLIALFCHARLVESRPAATRLTEFYIWMSVGGVLGGMFNALLAPVLFNGIYEYLLVLWLADLAVPRANNPIGDRIKKYKRLAFYALPAFVLYHILKSTGIDLRLAAIISGLIFLTGLGRIRQQGRLVLIDMAIMIGLVLVLPRFLDPVVYKHRSFFSVITVKKLDRPYGDVHKLIHGDTVHNFQLRDPALQTIPLAYYAKGNTFERALTAVRARHDNLNVAMIGLGAGAMACYEKPRDNWTYFEIDPAVVNMANDPMIFSYMAQCSISADIRIGDARLTISSLAPNSQDFLIIDAFTSDSIPSHLITREALALYQSRLKPDGVIFFHTSNRVADVSSVVVRLAEDAGWASRYIMRSATDFMDTPYNEFITPSTGVMVGRPADIEALLGDDRLWSPYDASPYVGVWSDDYSSIIGTIRAQRAR
ncbi:MAG: fused MFS/spermidine synthase, partial [Parvularculaceae bacterium]